MLDIYSVKNLCILFIFYLASSIIYYYIHINVFYLFSTFAHGKGPLIIFSYCIHHIVSVFTAKIRLERSKQYSASTIILSG